MSGTHIVITTIGDGQILLNLADNAARYDRRAVVWVIADRKTPAICRENCLKTQGNLDVHYLSPKDQDFLMRRYADFYKRLPWDSDSRRNIGYLLAYQAGCERLVLLDDDNFPGEDDLIGEHECVGEPYAKMGWEAFYYNYLGRHSGERLFPRGFPYSGRAPIDLNAKPVPVIGAIGVNIGVWSGDPDIDAASWLLAGAKIDYAQWRQISVLLSPGTWTPINSQNTCLHRELIPAAMFVVQRYPGLEFMDRFGDIFAGYFLQAVARELVIRIGSPIVEHRRNSHNHVADLCKEAPAIAILEWLLPKLREFKYDRASAIAVRYMQLANYLQALSAEKLPGWLPDQTADWLSETAFTMELYARACLEIDREKRQRLVEALT